LFTPLFIFSLLIQIPCYYAYYCLHKLHIRPREYAQFDRWERAFIVAAIDERIRTEKELENKLKSQ